MAGRKKALHGLMYTSDALDGLKAVEPKKHRQQIKARIDDLAKEPHPRGARKLKGADNDSEAVYRIRSGDYRVLYCIREDQIVVVLDIGHRKDIYR